VGGGDRGIIILNKPVSVGVYARGGEIVCACVSVCVCTPSLTPHFQMRMSALHCKHFAPYTKARYLPRHNYECVTMFMQVCVHVVRESVAFNARNARKTARKEARESARVGGNHLQSVSTRTPMALMKEDRHTALQIAHKNLVFHLTAQDIS